MNAVKFFIDNLWRISVCAFVFAAGLVSSRVIFYSFGLTLPRLPQQADESTALFYLLFGSFLLSMGIFPLAKKIGEAFFTRFLILFFFFFICFGISVSWESSIYSSNKGYDLMILIFLLPITLFSFTCISLTKIQPTSDSFLQKGVRFFKNKTRSEWAWRILLAILSFPFVYFVFGIIVSPFVADYYQGNRYGLVIPGIGTIIAVQLIRSLLFLLATLPIMISWVGNKIQLVAILGIAHFMFVFSYDIVLAYQLPINLVLTHAIEIFLDSMVYSWFIVKLIYSERSEWNRVQIKSA